MGWRKQYLGLVRTTAEALASESGLSVSEVFAEIKYLEARGVLFCAWSGAGFSQAVSAPLSDNTQDITARNQTSFNQTSPLKSYPDQNYFDQTARNQSGHNPSLLDHDQADSFIFTEKNFSKLAHGQTSQHKSDSNQSGFKSLILKNNCGGVEGASSSQPNKTSLNNSSDTISSSPSSSDKRGGLDNSCNSSVKNNSKYFPDDFETSPHNLKHCLLTEENKQHICFSDIQNDCFIDQDYMSSAASYVDQADKSQAGNAFPARNIFNSQARNSSGGYPLLYIRHYNSPEGVVDLFEAISPSIPTRFYNAQTGRTFLHTCKTPRQFRLACKELDDMPLCPLLDFAIADIRYDAARRGHEWLIAFDLGLDDLIKRRPEFGATINRARRASDERICALPDQSPVVPHDTPRTPVKIATDTSSAPASGVVKSIQTKKEVHKKHMAEEGSLIDVIAEAMKTNASSKTAPSDIDQNNISTNNNQNDSQVLSDDEIKALGLTRETYLKRKEKHYEQLKRRNFERAIKAKSFEAGPGDSKNSPRVHNRFIDVLYSKCEQDSRGRADNPSCKHDQQIPSAHYGSEEYNREKIHDTSCEVCCDDTQTAGDIQGRNGRDRVELSNLNASSDLLCNAEAGLSDHIEGGEAGTMQQIDICPVWQSEDKALSAISRNDIYGATKLPERIVYGRSAIDITSSMISEWKQSFPNLDLGGELKRVAVYLNANKKRYPTKEAALNLITNWLINADRKADRPKSQWQQYQEERDQLCRALLSGKEFTL